MLFVCVDGILFVLLYVLLYVVLLKVVLIESWCGKWVCGYF